MEVRYFDNSATTRVKEEVFKEMIPYLGIEYGNPSSIYSIGRSAKRAIEEARKTRMLTIKVIPVANNIFLWGLLLENLKLHTISNTNVIINIINDNTGNIKRSGICKSFSSINNDIARNAAIKLKILPITNPIYFTASFIKNTP